MKVTAEPNSEWNDRTVTIVDMPDGDGVYVCVHKVDEPPMGGATTEIPFSEFRRFLKVAARMMKA